MVSCYYIMYNEVLMYIIWMYILKVLGLNSRAKVQTELSANLPFPEKCTVIIVFLNNTGSKINQG